MTDVIVQVARFLAEQTEHGFGEEIFYYNMPDEVDKCAVVQRIRNRYVVPVQIDAAVHSLRIAVRAKTSDEAYAFADELYEALNNTKDEDLDDEPGFIQLEGTRAQVALYDHPKYQEQDQRGRKVFDFFAMLKTKS